MKTEVFDATGLADLVAAELGPEDKSRRPFELVATDDAVTGFRAELNSPKPSEALLVFRIERGGGAVDVFGACLGGGFGPVSKKPPPASGGGFVTCGAAG